MQVEGPPVALSTAFGATATFLAPDVSADTPLRFQLTVMDDDEAPDRDEVLVGIFPPGGSTDTMAPVSTITALKSRVKGNTYYEISIAASEPGLTYFSVSGDGNITGGGEDTTAMQLYTGPVSLALAKRGNGMTVTYYSTDLAGNVEATRTEVVQ